MKFVKFSTDRVADRLGIVLDDQVVDLETCYQKAQGLGYWEAGNLATKENFSGMVSFLKGGRSALDLGKELERFALSHIDNGGNHNVTKLKRPRKMVFPLEEVKLCPPVAPPKLLNMGGTYLTHTHPGVTRPPGQPHRISHEQFKEEVRNGKVIKRPRVFLKPPSSIIGPEEDVFIPAPFEEAVPDPELAIVIGKRGHRIPSEDAFDHIAGYTIHNDVAVKDIFTPEQLEEHGWTSFPEDKIYDTFAPLGPWIITKDEISNPHDLSLSLELNDSTIMKSNTEDMTLLWDIPKIVEHCSNITTLEVGDVIATGGPGPLPGKDNYFQHGDQMEANVEEIGTLRNYAKFEIEDHPKTRNRRKAPELNLPNDGNQEV